MQTWLKCMSAACFALALFPGVAAAKKCKTGQVELNIKTHLFLNDGLTDPAFSAQFDVGKPWLKGQAGKTSGKCQVKSGHSCETSKTICVDEDDPSVAGNYFCVPNNYAVRLTDQCKAVLNRSPGDCDSYNPPVCGRKAYTMPQACWWPTLPPRASMQWIVNSIDRQTLSLDCTAAGYPVR